MKTKLTGNYFDVSVEVRFQAPLSVCASRWGGGGGGWGVMSRYFTSRYKNLTLVLFRFLNPQQSAEVLREKGDFFQSLLFCVQKKKFQVYIPLL